MTCIVCVLCVLCGETQHLTAVLIAQNNAGHRKSSRENVIGVCLWSLHQAASINLVHIKPLSRQRRRCIASCESRTC